MKTRTFSMWSDFLPSLLLLAVAVTRTGAARGPLAPDQHQALMRFYDVLECFEPLICPRFAASEPCPPVFALASANVLKCSAHGADEVVESIGVQGLLNTTLQQYNTSIATGTLEGIGGLANLTAL